MNIIESTTIEELAELDDCARICDCWNDHTDEGLGHECPRGAAVRVSVTHRCGHGCAPTRDLLILCDPCLESWLEEPGRYEIVVLGRI